MKEVINLLFYTSKNKIIFIIIVFIFSGCKKDFDEYRIYSYPTPKSDYIIKIPKELPFTKDSIKYADIYIYDQGFKECIISFDLYNPDNTKDIFLIEDDSSLGRINKFEGMRKDFPESWLRRGCRGYNRAEEYPPILIKKYITVNEREDRYFYSYIAGDNFQIYCPSDENRKRIINFLHIRLDDIYLYFYIVIYEGDKPYIDLLKDIELVEKIKVEKVE